MTTAPWAAEDMVVLADLLMEESLSSPDTYQALQDECLKGTGWSVESFRALCQFRWNGSTRSQ